MNGREFKGIVFEQFAKIAQAFAAPKRLEIIDVLAQGERDVDTLAKQVSMTVANTSRHLQILKNTRLVKSHREGVRIIYDLADGDVLRCWLNLQGLAEKRSSEIRETALLFFKEHDSLEPLDSECLLQRMKDSNIILIDVRPVEEYQAGHIPGAISIPLAELKNRMTEIPGNHEIVAYCRGPYCVLSAEAETILNGAGFKSMRLLDGIPQWKENGLPVE